MQEEPAVFCKRGELRVRLFYMIAEEDEDRPTVWSVFLLTAISTYNNSIENMDAYVLLVLHM